MSKSNKDIVERLRDDGDGAYVGRLRLEAADEIEQLRAALGEVECELNVATNGKYLPYRFADAIERTSGQ